MIEVEFEYSKNALKFINKNPSSLSLEDVRNLVISALKKIFKIEETNIDLKMLRGDLHGYYRIRTGKIRIIFSLTKNKIFSAFVKDIGFRENIYK
jgi:mRNA interferase RelE/StbE